MTDVLFQMAALIALGAGWRFVRPWGLDGDATRKVLTSAVYGLFLPALVLLVLWQAPLGTDAVRTAVAAACGVVAGLAMAWGIYRLLRVPDKAMGALLLAAGFPNATYLGLPVLERVLGPTGRGIAIQYDLFACTPLLLTVGILIARLYGETSGQVAHPLVSLLKVPPLWAAFVGVLLNLAGVPLPNGLSGLLSMLGAAVVPLMLFSLGLGLDWQGVGRRGLVLMLPVVVIQLFLVPLLVWGTGSTLGLSGDQLIGVVLEGAMPSMVLGVVICDRFRLETPLYAGVVTLTTVTSMITLPLWFAWAG